MGTLNGGGDVKLDPDDSGLGHDDSLGKLSSCQPAYTGHKVHLLDLSDDVLLNIFKFCKPLDLKALGFSCRRLASVVADRSLWHWVDTRDSPMGKMRFKWYLQNVLCATTSHLFIRGYADEDWDVKDEEDEEPSSPQKMNEGWTDDSLEPEDPRYMWEPLWAYSRMSTRPCWVSDCNPIDVCKEHPKGSCPGPRFTFTDPLLRSLKATCNNLQTLALEYVNIDCSKTGLGLLPRKLKKLSLCGTKCYNRSLGTSFIFKIQDYQSNLEELDLSYCDWLEPACLMPLSKMPSLRHLILRCCPKMTEFVAYSALATKYGFHCLEIIDLRGSPVGDSEVSSFGWVLTLKELYASPAPGSDHMTKLVPRPKYEIEQWEEEIPECFVDAPLVDTSKDRKKSRDDDPLRSLKKYSWEESDDDDDDDDDDEPSSKKRRSCCSAAHAHMFKTSNNARNQEEVDYIDQLDLEVLHQMRVKSNEEQALKLKEYLKRDQEDARRIREQAERARSNLERQRRNMPGPSNAPNTYSNVIIISAKGNNVENEVFNVVVDRRPAMSVVNDVNTPKNDANTAAKAEDGDKAVAGTSNEPDITDNTEKDGNESKETNNTKDKPQEKEGLKVDGPPNSDINLSDTPRLPENTEEIKETVDCLPPRAEEPIKSPIKPDENDGTDSKCFARKKDVANEVVCAGTAGEVCNDEPVAGPSNLNTDSAEKISVQPNIDNKPRLNIPMEVDVNYDDMSGDSTSSDDTMDSKVEDSNVGSCTSVIFRRNKRPLVVTSAITEDKEAQEANKKAENVAAEEENPNPGPSNAEVNVEDYVRMPRNEVVFVNVKRRSNQAYRLSFPNELFSLEQRAVLNESHPIDPTSLVTDAAVHRFGRAINQPANYIHIGPNLEVIHGTIPGLRPDVSNLRVISITGYRNVTNRSLMHLASAAPRLRHIDVSNTRVNRSGVEAFKAMRPECEVIWTEPENEGES